MDLETIVSHFKGAVKSGDGYNVLCPAHEDKVPSLHIEKGEKGIVLNCFTGCNSKDIVKAAGLTMKDLFHDKSTSKPIPTPKVLPQQTNANLLDFNDYSSLPCTLDNYASMKCLDVEFLKSVGVTNNGRSIKILYHDKDGRPTKTRIRKRLTKQKNGTDTRFFWAKGGDLSLYGLERLKDYKVEDGIVLVEGESDCHTLWSQGVPAVGLPGASSWKDARDAIALEKFKIIYVVIESDAGGENVKKWLAVSGIKDRVRLVNLPANDISELFVNNPNGFKKAFNGCVVMAETFQEVDNETTVSVMSLDNLSNLEVVDNPVIEGLLGDGESLIVSADSGVGKSLLVTYIAFALGNPPEKGLWGLFKIPRMVKTLIVQSENGLIAFNKRLNKIFQACPKMREGAKNVFVTMVSGDCRLLGNLREKGFQQVLVDKMNEVGAKNLIIDPLISYHEEEENDNAGMRKALDCLTQKICNQVKCTVIIAHHNNKQGEFRGATSIRDWAANVLKMEVKGTKKGSTIIEVEHDKFRNYEQTPTFYLERNQNLDFLRCNNPEEKKIKTQAVIDALKNMGGDAKSQADLKFAIMEKEKCTEYIARNLVKSAIKENLIISIFDDSGNGKPLGYTLKSTIL